jgi:hypothetical protein
MNDLFTKERQDWIDDCRTTARKLLTVREEITIEDVLKKHPRPRYIHRNTTGQVFKHTDFEMCGWAKATKTSSRGRWIMKWKLHAEAFPMTMRQIRRARQPEMSE